MATLIRALAALAFLCCAQHARAQSCGTISSCPPAATPLSGNELLYLVQNGSSAQSPVVSVFNALATATLTFTNKTIDATKNTLLNLPVPALAGYALSPGNYALTNGGTGYAVGDQITLATTGATFSVSAVASVTAVSGGVITSTTLTRAGTATNATLGSLTFTQAATTGSGTGAVFAGYLAPIASVLSVPSLSTGGGSGAANGNTWIGDATPNIGIASSENTFLGHDAGAAFVGVGGHSTAIGLSACGTGSGSSSVTGQYNVCVGRNAGRNIVGTASENTFVGDSAAGSETGSQTVSGTANTVVGFSSGLLLGAGNYAVIVGEGSGNGGALTQTTIVGQGADPSGTGLYTTAIGQTALNGLTTGAQNTALGVSAGSSITTGSSNLVLGSQVGLTGMGAGSSNVVIGSTSGCTTNASTDSNTLVLCAGAGALLRITGGGTPSTSVFDVVGSLQTNITGSTQCVQASSTGVLSGAGAACGSGGGAVSAVANSDGTLTISPTTGNVVASLALGHANTWTATQTFPNGSLTNAELANNTISGIPLGSNLNTLTFGTHLTAGASSYNGSAAATLTSDATSANTASTIVARDGSGNFSAGTITAALTGHASSDLALSGGTMTGAINMGANNITNGGAITGTAITGTTANFTGILTAGSGIVVKTRTASSTTDSITTADYFVCAANGSAAATENLPSSPTTGQTFLIKDCSGAAATHSITITPASGNIDGASTSVISTNYGSQAVTYTGSQWSVN